MPARLVHDFHQLDPGSCSGNAAQNEQLLASLDISVLVGLRLWWESTTGCPKINQRLHWLQLMWLQHLKGCSSEDKVTEATVKVLFKVEVVKWINEVGPVEMSIDTEHLAEDSLANIDKIWRKATALANPVTLACKLREGSIECCWTGWNWSVRARGIQAT